jgi:hypothetical protein
MLEALAMARPSRSIEGQIAADTDLECSIAIGRLLAAQQAFIHSGFMHRCRVARLSQRYPIGSVPECILVLRERLKLLSKAARSSGQLRGWQALPPR